MPESEKYVHPLRLNEAWLCLDYANVIGWFVLENSADALTYLHLLSWAKQAEVIQDKTFTALQHQAQQHPKKTAQVVQQSLMLRDTIYRIFSTYTANKFPDSKDLDQLNLMLSDTLKRAQLVSEQGKFAWTWSDTNTQLDRPLWPVIWSAAELLTSVDLKRIGHCASEDCLWLFYDTSKNRSRRWCSMKMCGNVAKARRHYTRHKKSA